MSVSPFVQFRTKPTIFKQKEKRRPQVAGARSFRDNYAASSSSRISRAACSEVLPSGGFEIGRPTTI